MGVSTQLVYAGALGAAYAVLRERTRDSRAGRVVLDAALTYASTFVFPERPGAARRGRKSTLRRRIADPVHSADAFMRVTAMSLAALSR
jgi:hypothetical protein